MNDINNLNILNEMVNIGDMDVYTSLEEINELVNDFESIYFKGSNISINDPEEKKLIAAIKKNQLSYKKRNFIRTVFATIDGIVFAIKRILLSEEDNLKNEEIMNLQETKLIGPNSSRLEKKPFHNLSFTDNLKYTFKLYKKYISQNYIQKFNDSGWQKFIDSVEIRNKVTHPKTIDDLLVSDEDVKRVLDSYNWFIGKLNELLNNDNK